MALPLVHVLVINWNGLDYLQESFASLLDGTYEHARFILIDNASDDESVEFVRSTFGHDGRVEVIESKENLGWSRGNNLGLKHARESGADYAFLLNNDTVTAPDAIERMVDAAEAEPDIGALAPKILLYDYPDLLNSVGLVAALTGAAWDRGIGRLDGDRWNTVEPVIGVCGAACFLRMSALEKTGLLPTDFDIYLDDLDLCLRIWDAGYRILTCPRAVIRHKFSATMGQGKQARRKYYLNTRNRTRVIKRNFPIAKTPEIAAAYIVGEGRAIGRALLDGELWRAGAHVRSWAAASVYGPAALRERRARRKRGLTKCRFWDLMCRDRHFFPGTEFPKHGWYEPRQFHGERVVPMSRNAIHEHTGGKLRITQLNCCPEAGPLDVQVSQNGAEVAHLTTTSREELTLDLPAGNLEFQARRIFQAEDTGEKIDIGGWLNITSDRT